MYQGPAKGQAMAGPTKRKSRVSVERGVIDYIQRPTADAGTGVILMGP